MTGGGGTGNWGYPYNGYTCQRCGFFVYNGAVHNCMTHYHGYYPYQWFYIPVTSEQVRQIVREELEKALQKKE